MADGLANVLIELLHRLVLLTGVGAQFDGTYRDAFVEGRAQGGKRYLRFGLLHVVGLGAHADDAKSHRIDIYHLSYGRSGRPEEVFGHARRDNHHLSAFAQVVFVDKTPCVERNALHLGRNGQHAVETSLEAVFARDHDESGKGDCRRCFTDLRLCRRTGVFKVAIVDLYIPPFTEAFVGFRSVARHNRHDIVGEASRIVLESMNQSVARAQ